MPQVDLCKTCKPESLTIIQLQKITVDLVIHHPKASYKEATEDSVLRCSMFKVAE